MSSNKKQKVGDAVQKALNAAQSELEEREAKLEERETALKKAIDGVEKEMKLMAGRTPRDVLRLNIGGTRVSVLRRTLCLYEDSLLAAHFSGRWDENVEKDEEGAFFFDQPAELMMALINFLRAKAIETPTSPTAPPDMGVNGGVADLKRQADFQRLVEFYGMTPFVYQQVFKLHRGVERTGEVGFGPTPSVNCAERSTFVLNSVGHSRKIQSFEVVLGITDRPQIGWAQTTHEFCEDDCFESCSLVLADADHQGVGEEGESIALVLHRGGIFFKGALVMAISNLTLQAGSVVTCEMTASHFRWVVDGTEVASIMKISTMRSGGKVEPAISSKGQWDVTQVTY